MSFRPVTALAAATVLVASSAPAALAVDEEYPPTIPTRVAAVCVGDVPFLSYAVDFGENNAFVGRPMTITFVNPAGENFVIDTTVPAPGTSQQVLWPGASVSPPDWPGWVLDADGQWVESTTDPGAFTRAPGGVEVQFAVNPTLTTRVTYPPASAVCANPKNVTPTGGGVPGGGVPSGGGESIPATGGSLLPGILGGAALLLGGGLVAASRRKEN